MDFSKIEGLELSDEQKSAIVALHQAELEAETSGLKSKNNELINEKRTAAEAAEKARLDAEEARLDRARKAGEVETIEKSLSERFENEKSVFQKQIEALNGEILGSKKESIIAGLSDKFTVSPELTNTMLSGMVSVERTESGISTQFKDLQGNLVTTDPSKFVEYLSTQDTFKGILKGVNSNGGGANGGAGNGGGAVKANLTGTTSERASALSERIPAFKELPIR